MLLALLGMAGVGWLAGESIRRGRRLGQRGLPGPMPPPPGESFTRCQKLLSEIDQTLDRALKNYEKARDLSDQAKAIQLELGAHPGWRTGPGFEALKKQFEKMQSLMRQAQTHQNAGEALERGWRDLWDKYRKECEPQPQGMLMPQGQPATSQMTTGVYAPSGEQSFTPGMLAPAALPKGGSPVALPSITTIEEATAVPVRSPVASIRRPGISVPLPTGSSAPMAFTGTLSGFGLGQRGLPGPMPPPSAKDIMLLTAPMRTIDVPSGPYQPAYPPRLQPQPAQPGRRTWEDVPRVPLPPQAPVPAPLVPESLPFHFGTAPGGYMPPTSPMTREEVEEEEWRSLQRQLQDVEGELWRQTRRGPTTRLQVPLPAGGGTTIPFGTLGQRGIPIPPPQPFTEAPDWPQIPTMLGILVFKLKQAQTDLLRYQAMFQEAEQRFDALDQANASAETLREAGAVAQDLSARVEDAEERVERYEGELEDLAAAGEEPMAPPPVYQGVPIPPFVPPLPWPKSLPQEREPIVTAPFRGAAAAPMSLAPSGMPRPGTVGPAVSVAAETAKLPTPSTPTRRTVSVPFAPSGGGMTFTGM